MKKAHYKKILNRYEIMTAQIHKIIGKAGKEAESMSTALEEIWMCLITGGWEEAGLGCCKGSEYPEETFDDRGEFKKIERKLEKEIRRLKKDLFTYMDCFVKKEDVSEIEKSKEEDDE